MHSTITARGQTVVPAPIRERFGLGTSTRLEWIVDGDGAIRVVPVDLDPIRAFRGSGAGESTNFAARIAYCRTIRPWGLELILLFDVS